MRTPLPPRRHRAVMFALLAAGAFAPPAARAADVALISPAADNEPEAFGLRELTAALRDRGLNAVRPMWERLSVREIEALPRDFTIIVHHAGRGGAVEIGEPALPEAAESFRLLHLDRPLTRPAAPADALLVEGRDSVGAMYGCLELADRLRARPTFTELAEQAGLFVYSDDREAVQREKERIKAAVRTEALAALRDAAPFAREPYLRLRGTNPFLFQQALDDEKSWFFQQEFWTDYLQRLARSRHNFLDLHAAYDLSSTYFPNIYPTFVHLEEFADIGVGPERAARNMEMLRWIIAAAKAHGLKTGLMNYNAATKDRDGQAVTGARLAAYIRAASTALIQALPDLWVFGFRIGESGQPEDFFAKTYLAALREAGGSVNVYTRSWLATRDKILPITEGFAGEFFIECKYNGEQLGLPYHAITSPQLYAPSYSYEAYTEWPRNYQLIHQVRAGGTHRIFPWLDTTFIRRAVESFRLGNAAGFTLEPLTAYYPLEMEAYHRPSGRRLGNRVAIFQSLSAKEIPPWFRWATERDWYWYEAWGRLSYDPTVPREFFRTQFERRFGAARGGPLFDVLETASDVVPLIYSAHCLGPDHRNMAPEFEVGNDTFKSLAGERLPGSLDDFIRVRPLDSHAYADVRTTVRFLETGESDGRMDVLDVAGALLADADAIESGNKALWALSGRLRDLRLLMNNETAGMMWQFQAVAHLARYYAHKLRAAVAYQRFVSAGYYGFLVEARRELRAAHDAWDALADLTDDLYVPLLETLRMKTESFTWREEGRRLAADWGTIWDAEREVVARRERSTRPLLGNAVPGRLPAAGGEFVVSTVSRGNFEHEVTLHYQADGAADWTTLPLGKRDATDFAAHVGPQPEGTRWQYFYMVKRRDAEYRYPEHPEEFFAVRFTDDRAAPVVTFAPLTPDRARGEITIVARIEDAGSGLADVDLFYKPLPSNMAWRRAPMSPIDRESWAATVPFTPSGLMYFVLAKDRAGNARHEPYFREQRPYLVIESWEAAPATPAVRPEPVEGRTAPATPEAPPVPAPAVPGTDEEY